MNAQYRTINYCLQLLKESNMAAVKKLRVERQLIQIKRLILKHDRPDQLAYGPSSQGSLDASLMDLRKTCTGGDLGGGGDDGSDVVQQIRDIIGSLFSEETEKSSLLYVAGVGRRVYSRGTGKTKGYSLNYGQNCG